MKKLTLEDTKKMSPKGWWETFYQIAQIPHGSGNCKKLADFLQKKFSAYKGCTVHRDKWDNLFIQVAPSKGKEKWPSICFQGHMDMVCAQDPGSTHDFLKDPLELILEDNHTLHADHTTLGADDAIAIATMAAIIESGVSHGPLEFLITADEETTTAGAINFKPNSIQSPYLINLDIEHIDTVYFGCAGVLSHYITFEIERTKKNPKQVYMELRASGMRGGHSGEEIHNKRANAIKVLFDLLFNLRYVHKLDISLVSVAGGQAKNAIPMNCSAVISINKTGVKKAEKILDSLFQDFQTEFLGADTPQFCFDTHSDESLTPIKQSRSDEIIAAINGIFDGMHRYNFDYGNMESSSNIGVIRTTNEDISCALLTRAIFDSAMTRIYNQIKSIVEGLAHGISTTGEHIKPWTPKPGRNPLLDTYLKSIRKNCGSHVTSAVCAGTFEAGIIVTNNPNIKYAIGCGIKLADWHTPKETLFIDTLQPFFKTILELISTVNNWE